MLKWLMNAYSQRISSYSLYPVTLTRSSYLHRRDRIPLLPLDPHHFHLSESSSVAEYISTHQRRPKDCGEPCECSWNSNLIG